MGAAGVYGSAACAAECEGKMKVYWKKMFAVFVSVLIGVGSGVALFHMPVGQVAAEDGVTPPADTGTPTPVDTPTPIPTPTPTPTLTPTPTATPTPTVTPTPIATPTVGGLIPTAPAVMDTVVAAGLPTPTPFPSVSAGTPIVIMDYTNYTAWLAVGANDKYAMLETLKVKKDKNGAVTSATKGNQYVYDLVELTKSTTQKGFLLDLSFLKATSDQYIKVYGDANPANATQVQINAQPKKPSIKYVGGQFTAKIDRKDVILNPIELDKYEYKTLYGSKWDSLRNYNGTTSSIAGTTLLIRQKATLTTPASVETKIKVAAAAKAPKVAIDYVKGTISIPKGVEFKVFAMGKEGNWTRLEAAGKLTPTELLAKFMPYVNGALTDAEKKEALEKRGFSVIARTAAVLKNNVVTKSASQPIFLDIPATTTVAKAENENKILGSVPALIYLTYQNVEKGVEMTAVGGNFDYSIDDGKTWKTIKPTAKKPTVAKPKGDVKGVLVRESGTKETKSKDGIVTPARLPSSNFISTAWMPPLTISLAGNGVGSGDTIIYEEGTAVDLVLEVKQGKDVVNDAQVQSTTVTTIPPACALSVTNGKLAFTVPAYNEGGTNTYVIEVVAKKTSYTDGVIRKTIQVTKKMQ